jgi:hypothetical protein
MSEDVPEGLSKALSIESEIMHATACGQRNRFRSARQPFRSRWMALRLSQITSFPAGLMGRGRDMASMQN